MFDMPGLIILMVQIYITKKACLHHRLEWITIKPIKGVMKEYELLLIIVAMPIT
jgi:hypothetical protein